MKGENKKAFMLRTHISHTFLALLGSSPEWVFVRLIACNLTTQSPKDLGGTLFHI